MEGSGQTCSPTRHVPAGRPPLTTMTSVRGPPLSSQKYKSFYYSRVASVAEEDYFDGTTPPSSFAGSFNCNVETEDNASLETNMLKSSARSQEAVSHGNFRMMDESSNAGGSSEPSLNKDASSAQLLHQQHIAQPAAASRRLQRLILSPPSLHMSFDVDNSPWPQQPHRLNLEKPISKSTDNVAHRLTPGAVGEGQLLVGSGRRLAMIGQPPSPAHFRHAAQAAVGARVNTSEIAQISAGYMRTSGLVGQFRGVLSAPLEKGVLQRMNLTKKQSSKDKEHQRKDTTDTCSKKTSICSSTTALFWHGSIQKEQPDMPTNATSVDFGPDTSVASASVKNFSIDGDPITPRCSTLKPLENKPPPVAHEDGSHSKCHRLEYHRRLFDQRRKACDYAVVCALIGIALMIVETELTASGFYAKESSYSYVLKSLIVFSTITLLVLILAYHAADIKLFMLDYGCDDWRIAIRQGRVFVVALELIVCMICPFPGNFYFIGLSDYIQPRVNDPDGATATVSSVNSSNHVPIDVVLSIPMFLRLYLIRRQMLLHSKLFTDGPSRSISALNRVNITARLVLKMLMTISPVKMLLAFTGTFWLTAAWIMLVCERYGVQPQQQSGSGYDYDTKRHQSLIDFDSSKHESYLNSIWLVAVTSLTIGYGDTVPNTYCGRTVSIICGIVGAGTSSLVVAVVAKKLEFSRAEKHVHNFMMDSLLTKRMKNAAANVLRETWLIYKHRKLAQKMDAATIRYHQRKFLLAIYELRKTKRGRRKLDENFITVGDMAKMSMMTYEMISEMRTRQQEMEQKIADTDKRCANVEAYMGQLQVSLCALPELVARKLRAPSPAR